MHSLAGHEEVLQKKNDIITDIAIGLSDGLIVPFAIASGLSSVVDSNSVIIITGIIAIVAGSLMMGVGGYFTNKKRLSHYNQSSQQEQEEAETILQSEIEAQRKFYSNIGLSRDMQEKAIEEMIKDEKVWHELIKTYELKQDKPAPKKAARFAFIIAVSYAIGGLIPLSSYFFTGSPIDGLKISAIITLTCLFIFGFLKSKFTGINLWIGAFRVMLTGAIAGGAAFVIARVFE